ncbi:MAG: GNAT family N-acetyltransferase [Bacteroidota bacterium]
MSSLTVRPISSKKDTKDFIKFQWDIYKEYPNWVPPLLMDRRKLMDRDKNPFYKHADAEFYLAFRDGKIVGRIGAIINHNHNKEHKEIIGFFGFFESINDQSVADELFKTAIEWMKKKGVSAVRGPASPSVNDEYGLLIEGFEFPPVLLMSYNPPYYAKLIEAAGFKKAKDLYAYQVVQESVFDPKLVRMSEIIKQREGLTFRTLNMDDFDGEVKRIKDLYNRAWQYNWGAVPMTDEEFDALAKDLKPVVIPEFVIIVEFKGEPIGFSLSLPDLNIALKHNKNGHLLTGLMYMMLFKKKIHRARIMVLGVVKEFQRTGAGGVLFYETARRGIDLGYYEGEASWVLEDNVMMNRGAELMHGKRWKTYRIYEKSIT